MARKSVPSFEKSHNGISADEFQSKLLNWFEDRGLLSDLQAHLRRQMIVALRDTSLNIHTTGSFHQAGSPKLQAINLLVAEFLLQQEYHYTLSVFTSEVPLLRNLPEFTPVATSTNTLPGNSPGRFPGFQERDVFDILEALGFSSNSTVGRNVNELYQNAQGEALLLCLIRSLPESTHINKNKSSTDATTEKDVGKSSNVIERQNALQELSLFGEDMQSVIANSSLEAEQITQLHAAIVRLIELEQNRVREDEEAKFNKELVDREHRIQAEWERQEEEIHQKLQQAEEKFQEERCKLEQDVNQKQVHLSELAAQLREQQNEVANRLNYIQERNNFLEQREMELKSSKKKSEDHINKISKALENKEKQLEEEFARLELESREREKEKEELTNNRIQLERVSKAVLESQAEIAFLKQFKEIYEAEIKKSKETGISTSNEAQTSATRRKKKSSTCSLAVQTSDIEPNSLTRRQSSHQQTAMISCETRSLQTQIRGSDMDDAFLELRKQCAENERQRSQHEMYGNLVEQLQQDNTELRGHNEQQRLRIQELTTQAAQLASQLDDANTALALLNNRPTTPERDQHGVQTVPPARSPVVPPSVPPSVSMMGAVPGLALGTVGYQVPPPAPPQPHTLPRTRPTSISARSRQVGAGEESYFSRHLAPEVTRHPGTPPPPREQRRKPPRRLMVHSVSSSDESNPSPTEEMLREARRRLRRLEEETQAVDRSYQEFRMRHADSLAGSPSVLFHPMVNDYSSHFQLPTPSPFLTRPHTNSSHFVTFPSVYNRSRLFNTQSNLMSQLYPGVYQPYPLFSLSRANDHSRYPYIYTTNQSQPLQNITSLYSVPTQVFGTGSPSITSGNSVNTTTVHIPPICSSHMSNRTFNVNRGSSHVSSRMQPPLWSRNHPEESGHLVQNSGTFHPQHDSPQRVFSVPQIPVTIAQKPLQQISETSCQNGTSTSQPQNTSLPSTLHKTGEITTERHENIEGKREFHKDSDVPSMLNFNRPVPIPPVSTILPEPSTSKRSEVPNSRIPVDVQYLDNNAIPQKATDSEISSMLQKQSLTSVSNYRSRHERQLTDGSIPKKKGSSRTKITDEGSLSTGNSVGSLEIDVIKEAVNIPNNDDQIDPLPAITSFHTLSMTSELLQESRDNLVEKPSTTCITEISERKETSEKESQLSYGSVCKKNSHLRTVSSVHSPEHQNNERASVNMISQLQDGIGTENHKKEKTEEIQQEQTENGNFFIPSRDSDQVFQTSHIASQNSFGRASSSDPSTLASSKDLSSEVQISAGKDKSDDSW